MSLQKNLSVQITTPQQTALEAAIDAAIAEMNGIHIVVLSEEERGDTPAVGPKRLPYVLKAVNDLGPAYPDLVGKAVTTAAAKDALDSFTFLDSMLTKIEELRDRGRDLSMNLQNTTYNYTTDMYYTAKRYEEDVPGADVVIDELEPLYEGQGHHATTPSTP